MSRVQAPAAFSRSRVSFVSTQELQFDSVLATAWSSPPVICLRKLYLSVMSRPHRIRRHSMDESSSDEEYVPTRSTRQREQVVRPGSEDESSGRRPVVQHHYHDHRGDPLQIVEESSSKQRPRGGVTVAFPEKLFEMLVALQAEGRDDIISWQPHGRCFAVHNKKDFVEEVMPRFFHQSKLTSFQRQLNLYGFVRLTAGQDRGGYYHELFLRGRPDLCRQITRTRIKGNGMKAASSPSTEPNFYFMTPCQEGDVDVVRYQEPTVVSSHDDSSEDEESQRHLFVVSPPGSPQVERSIAMHPMMDSFQPNLNDMAPWRLDDASLEENQVPQTGDVAFFEGHKFRYLDHSDLMDTIGGSGCDTSSFARV